MSRAPWITALVLLSALAASAAPGLAGRLQFEPAMAGFETWWRALGCHFVHWSSAHLLWNLFALGALGAACETRGRRGLLAVLLATAVAVPVALWLVQPELPSYRGLSGLASGCFTLVAVRIARRASDSWRRMAAWALLGLFAAKSVYELVLDQAVFAGGGGADFVPVPFAHIVAGGVGLVVGWMESPRRRGMPQAVAS